jgi:cell division septum initiation protein DivIVA
MALSQRLNEKRAHMKEHKLERDLDKASEEGVELKAENRTLRDEVERGQDERDRLVVLLEKMEKKVGVKKKKTGRRVAFLGLGGLAAWAFGSESGRRTVARMKERISGDPRFQELQDRAAPVVEDLQAKAAPVVRDVQDKANQVVDKANQAADKAAGSGDKTS